MASDKQCTMSGSKTNQISTMSLPNRAYGEKGADVWEDTGSALLDYSVSAVRGASEESLLKILRVTSLRDAYAMAFHVRNIRGGKGERDVFKDTMRLLYETYPELTLDLLDLVPHYGCWDDLFSMVRSMYPDKEIPVRVADIAAAQLRVDRDTPLTGVDGKQLSISLCAKWAPRERSGTKTDMMVQDLAARIFPDLKPHSAQMAAYRRLVVGLNQRLKTVETLMHAGSWATIDPKSVPGRAGKLYSRAFLNLTSTTKSGKKVSLDVEEKAALRCPDDADRMVCRDNFAAHFAAAAKGRAVVHGANTLFPHEVVKKAWSLLYLQEGQQAAEQAEMDQLVAVWNSMVAAVKAAGNGLDDCEVMCDFSGSMKSAKSQGDTPFWVSIALGILISEITGRNRIMSFDSKPRWHIFPGGDLFTKLKSLPAGFAWGLSTNFQAAYSMIAAEVKRSRPAKGNGPKFLLVLTDMNFDAATNSEDGGRHHYKTARVQTHAEMGRETFRRLGEDMHGDPDAYPAPVLGFWNLAANPTDFQGTANEEGVIMLSGWSAAQFNILQKEGLRATTPLELLRMELDAPQYDRVRARVDAFLAAPKPYISHANGFGAEE